MKRTVAILAGVATVGVAVYLGSRLLAQQQVQLTYPHVLQPAAGQNLATPRSHICLINIGQVIKKYKKFENFEKELKVQRDSAQHVVDEKKSQGLAWKAEFDNPGTPLARKETLERNLKQLQREVQDMSDEFQQGMQKKEFDMLVQIYKEVQEAAVRYAQVRDIDLVLQYSDPVSQDYFLPAFFQRKLANNACMPMVMAAGMEITEPITEMLNKRLEPAAPTTAPSAH